MHSLLETGEDRFRGCRAAANRETRFGSRAVLGDFSAGGWGTSAAQGGVTVRGWGWHMPGAAKSADQYLYNQLFVFRSAREKRTTKRRESTAANDHIWAQCKK